MQRYFPITLSAVGLTLLIVLSLELSLSSCQSEATANTDSTALDSAVTQNANLLRSATIDTARRETVNNELNLTGKITFNQDKMVKVYPLVGGHIEQVKVELGDFVRKGQTLAIVRSGDLADLEQQAVSARGQLAVSQKNYQVAEDMTKGGLTSQRELVAAREQLAAARGEVARVAERRQILGGNGSIYVIKAPMNGFVVEKTAAQGMEIRSDDPENLFTVSNLDEVWVIANVYESDVANVHEGELATVTTLSYPDHPYKGRIDKVFNVLDPDSKTMKVRVTLLNREVGSAAYQLKPEMFTNVSVTYAGRDQRVAIPARAVVFDKSRNFVVMVNARNQPIIREVDIYKTIGDRTYLNTGLSAGDRIVTRNQLLIYSALAN